MNRIQHLLRPAIAVIGVVVLAAGCGRPAATSSDTTQPNTSEVAAVEAAPPIDEERLRTRIATLADDAFEGRAPATPGGARTRTYLADQMKAIGLVPAVPGPDGAAGYEQIVPLVSTTLDPAQSFFAIGDRRYAYGSEAVYWTKRVQERVAFEGSDVVFVGYGVVAPEYDWDDYAGIDVSGKTVLILINDPGFATRDPEFFNGSAMTYYGRWTYKFEEAARKGASAAIVIHQSEPAAYGWGVVEGSWTGPQIDLVRPDAGASRVALEGWLQEGLARSVFADAGEDFDALIAQAATREFRPVELGVAASADITNTIHRSESANVAGMIVGNEAPGEYILYTAHWDHLGASAAGEDAISNGAVDNATGTAGILAIAQSIHGMKTPPRRSVVFLAVTGEESGLLGSAYFAEDPFLPLGQIVGGVNIDAILPLPPTRNLVVTGYGASELEDILKAEADERGLYVSPDPEPEKGYFYRSDHISIAKKGVPMLYADLGPDLVDGGVAAGEAVGADYRINRYHKPADEYDPSWDVRAMTGLLEIMRDVGLDLANGTDWPNWYEGTEFRSVRDAQRAIAAGEMAGTSATPEGDRN